MKQHVINMLCNCIRDIMFDFHWPRGMLPALHKQKLEKCLYNTLPSCDMKAVDQLKEQITTNHQPEQ
jgi:hypothetical protein